MFKESNRTAPPKCVCKPNTGQAAGPQRKPGPLDSGRTGPGHLASGAPCEGRTEVGVLMSEESTDEDPATQGLLRAGPHVTVPCTLLKEEALELFKRCPRGVLSWSLRAHPGTRGIHRALDCLGASLGQPTTLPGGTYGDCLMAIFCVRHHAKPRYIIAKVRHARTPVPVPRIHLPFPPETGCFLTVQLGTTDTTKLISLVC